MLVILIALAVLVLFDFAALRWGADSREHSVGSTAEPRVDWRAANA